MWLRIGLAAALCLAAYGDDLARGKIIDAVKCAGNEAQSYALYLPSNYTPERRWNLILGFDPRARGRAAVEPFQAAAEKYGYIVAGSNNSRNGPPQASLMAAEAMWSDVVTRFSVNDKRIYTAGLSGGARIAMKAALDTDEIAGVIASSAGFPPYQRASRLNFVVFGTAGTEDFNYIEMRQFDEQVTTPHRVAIFEGGHTWLPSNLATKAIEWMEIQAMRSGASSRDQALLDKLFAARAAEATAQKSDLTAMQELQALAADFQGLKDVSKFEAQAAALEKKTSVIQELNKERHEEQQELQTENELADLQRELGEHPPNGDAIFKDLRERLLKLSQQANARENSAERRIARRVLSGIMIDSRAVDDPEYQKFVDSLRPAR